MSGKHVPASTRLALMYAERERRRKLARDIEEGKADATDLARELRGIYYDKQRAFFTSLAKRRATRKTRRSGATTGGCREYLARAIERPRWRGTYVTTTRIEAKDRAWKTDTESGFLDLLMRYGRPVERRQITTYELGKLEVEVREQDLALEFSNGSRINLFGADDEASLNKQRGLAKHAYWIDEAQDFRYLDRFYKAVIVPALVDFDGECWLSGTPGRDCVGFFYEVTREDPQPEFAAAWEVHSMAVTDNPFFGKTAEERWERTAGSAMRENGWAATDPDLLREWFARWVTAGANYVYAVHSVPAHALAFAPQRASSSWRKTAAFVRGMTPELTSVLHETGWYDHDAAIADLPRRPNGRPYTWLFGMGMDFGHNPDPVALSIPAFTPELPDVWEMWSWKRVGLVPDDWRCLVELVFRQIMEGLVALVGDPGGLVGAELTAWRERLGLPIEPADKAGKESWIEMLNGDIRRGKVHYREGSPLLDEHRHLVWQPAVAGRRRKEHADRRLADGRVPGNHNSDSWLYIYRHLTHHAFRPELPKEGTMVRQEQQHEAEMERVTARAARMRVEDDEDDGDVPIDL